MLLFEREKFGFVNGTRIRLRKVVLCQVGGHRGTAVVEQRVNDVPRHPGSVESVSQLTTRRGGDGHSRGLREEVGLSLRGGSHHPVAHRHQVDGRLSGLKIIDIGCTTLTDLTVVARNEMGKLAVEIQVRFGGRIVESQQINSFREKRHLGLISEIHTPNQVVDRLIAIIDLIGDRTLAQIQQRGTHREILGENIIQIHTEHALVGLIGIVYLRRDLNRRSGSQDALVDDRHHTHVVVDGVVDIFRQLHTAGCHLHRFGRTAAREVEFGTIRRTVTTLNVVLVLVGDLLRHRLRHRVQRIESVFVGQLRLIDHRTQVLTERLGGGEIDAAVIRVNRTTCKMGAVNEVENTIGRGILLLVQTVQTHQPNQRNALLRTLREETIRGALGVARVEDVQAEFVGRDLIGRKAIHVLHHQIPQRRFGVQVRALQQLGTYTVRGGHLVGELTHLVHFVVADHGVLERNGQHLVGGQRGVQGDETQFGVHRVFVGRQQTRTLHLFVVGSGLKSDGLHVAGNVGDIADQRTVGVSRQVVDIVVRILPTGICGIIGKVGRLRIILTQVRESHNVTIIRSSCTHCRAPHLDLGNHDGGTHQRQRAQILIIMLFEELGEEVVLVLLVFVGPEVEIGLLGTTRNGDGLRRALLAGSDRRNEKVTELQLRFYTKKALATGN